MICKVVGHQPKDCPHTKFQRDYSDRTQTNLEADKPIYTPEEATTATTGEATTATAEEGAAATTGEATTATAGEAANTADGEGNKAGWDGGETESGEKQAW